MEKPDRLSRQRAFVLSIFVLSGATGLVYEIVWSRMLTVRVFGTTAYAISTVLAAFMAGLALGAYWLGRRADEVERPLRLYAILEAAIGLYAILFPFILSGIVRFYLLFARGHDPNFGLALLRFLLAFLALVVPATMMGATLPAVTRYLARARSRLGKDVGFLYAANTFGAVAGTLLAAFLLIRTFGLHGTLLAAGIVNFLLAAAAWFFGGERMPPSVEEPEPTESPTEELQSPAVVRASIAAFGLSGFAALAYEVLWTRILVFFLGSTTYAFATMLAAFLAGIAAGSLLFARVAVRGRNLVLLLGYAQAAIAIGAVVLLPAFSEVYTIVRAIGVGGRLTVFLVCVALMGLPTFLMGATFPFVTQIVAGRTSRLASAVGGIYAVNTIGAILGSLVAGFVLTPVFGIRNSVLLVALVNLVAAGWVLRSDPRLARWERLLPTVAGVAVVFVAFVFFPRTAFFVKSAIYQEQFTRRGLKAEILYYDEGADASVTVIRDPEDAKRLYVDTNEAANDTRWDAPSHRVIAHVPLLLHPNPKRALVVGFGMGRTSNSIIQHDVFVDAVEISPGVPKAARLFFSEANNGVLDSPLLNLHINDGRNFILTTRERYDMISTGIIHPLVSAGSSSIYSRDFYEMTKSILTENGVMSQWVPLHRLPLEDFKTIIRTFLDVFPNTTVWYKYTPDFLILIGTKGEQTIDIRDWIRRTRSPKIDAELAKDDLDTWSLLDSFFMGPEAARRFVGDGPIHSDDRPILEFFRGDLGGTMTTQTENIRAIAPYRESVFPLLRNFRDAKQKAAIRERLDRYFEATQKLIQGQAEFASQRYDEALAYFQEAARINPDDPTIGYNQRETTNILHREVEEEIADVERELRERVRQNPKDIEALTNLALAYRNRGRLDAAIETFERALRLEPERLELLILIGETYQQNGQIEDAIRAYEKANALAPSQPIILGSLAAFYEEAGRIDDAIRTVKKVIEIDPNLAIAYSTLGALYASKGDYERAAQAYRQALNRTPPRSVAWKAWSGLGYVLGELGRYEEAEEAFEKALEIHPTSQEVRENLEQVRKRLGR